MMCQAVVNPLKKDEGREDGRMVRELYLPDGAKVKPRLE
jgi:hypothetical protein